MTNYTQGPATCKHPSIVAWTLAEGDDAGEPAGLWSCRDCGHKFYPWTAVEEAVRAEVKGLQDKLDAATKLVNAFYNGTAPMPETMYALKQTLGVTTDG